MTPPALVKFGLIFVFTVFTFSNIVEYSLRDSNARNAGSGFLCLIHLAKRVYIDYRYKINMMVFLHKKNSPENDSGLRKFLPGKIVSLMLHMMFHIMSLDSDMQVVILSFEFLNTICKE